MSSRVERTPLLPAYEHPYSKPKRPLPPLDRSASHSVTRSVYHGDSGSDSDDLTPTLLHTVRSHSDVQSLKLSIDQSNSSYLYDLNYARTPSPVPSIESSPGEESTFDSPFASFNQSIHHSLNPLTCVRFFMITSISVGLIARRALLVHVNDKYGLFCLFCMIGLFISLAHCLIDQSTKQSTNLFSSLSKLPWMRLMGIALIDCLVGCSLFLCIAVVPAYVSIALPVIGMSLLSISQVNHESTNHSDNQSANRSVFYSGVGLIVCALFVLVGDCLYQSHNPSASSTSNHYALAGFVGLVASSFLTMASNSSKQRMLYDQLIDCHVFSVALALITLIVAMMISPIILKGEHYINQSISQSIDQSIIPPMFKYTTNDTSSTGSMFSSTGLTNLTEVYDQSADSSSNPSVQPFVGSSFVSLSFVEPYSFNLSHAESHFPNFGSTWLHLCQQLISQSMLLLIMIVWIVSDQATKRLSLSISESNDDPTSQISTLMSISVFLACLSLLALPQWLTASSDTWWIIGIVGLLTSLGVWLMHINHQDPSNEVDIWESVWSPMQKAIEEEERASQSAAVLNQSIQRGYKLPSPKRPVPLAQPIGRPRVF